MALLGSGAFLHRLNKPTPVQTSIVFSRDLFGGATLTAEFAALWTGAVDADGIDVGCIVCTTVSLDAALKLDGSGATMTGNASSIEVAANGFGGTGLAARMAPLLFHAIAANIETNDTKRANVATNIMNAPDLRPFRLEGG